MLRCKKGESDMGLSELLTERAQQQVIDPFSGVSVTLHCRVSERDRPSDGSAHQGGFGPSLGAHIIECLAKESNTDRRS